MSGTIRAVVVRWRGGDEVRRCLSSLIEHGNSHIGRIVLVDSGSGDGGAETLAARFPEIQVIALDENLGFAHAANCGMKAGEEPLLMLLNPDAQVVPESIDILISTLHDHPNVAGVVPILEGTDGSSQVHWQLRRLPSVARLAFGFAGAPAFRAQPTEPSAVPQPAAAAWLVRRSVWDALDGLDPVFAPAWWEDVDFCARLESELGKSQFPAGERFWVNPDARMIHLGGSSVSELGEAAFFAIFNRNLLRYANRHHPQQFGFIRIGLHLSLATRALLRPSRRNAYRTGLTAIRDFSNRPG